MCWVHRLHIKLLTMLNVCLFTYLFLLSVNQSITISLYSIQFVYINRQNIFCHHLKCRSLLSEITSEWLSRLEIKTVIVIHTVCMLDIHRTCQITVCSMFAFLQTNLASYKKWNLSAFFSWFIFLSYLIPGS